MLLKNNTHFVMNFHSLLGVDTPGLCPQVGLCTCGHGSRFAHFSFSVNLIAVMTLLLTSGFHRCYQRIFKKNTNYPYAVRFRISLAILDEIFNEIGNFF